MNEHPYRHDLALHVDDPSLPWNMDLQTAKELAVICLRDLAETPEDVEVYCQVGAMVRLGWIEHVLAQQRERFLEKQRAHHSPNEPKGLPQ